MRISIPDTPRTQHLELIQAPKHSERESESHKAEEWRLQLFKSRSEGRHINKYLCTNPFMGLEDPEDSIEENTPNISHHIPSIDRTNEQWVNICGKYTDFYMFSHERAHHFAFSISTNNNSQLKYQGMKKVKINELGEKIWENILRYMDPQTIYSICLTSRFLFAVLKSYWYMQYMEKFMEFPSVHLCTIPRIIYAINLQYDTSFQGLTRYLIFCIGIINIYIYICI